MKPIFKIAHVLAAMILLSIQLAFARQLPLELIKLPDGFYIEIYADNVPNARSMTLSPNGILYVGTRTQDVVYAVVDSNKDFKADKVYTIAEKLLSPNGVAFKDGNLFVAEINRVIRFDDIDNHLENPPKFVVVNDSFPSDTWHGWKYLRFGPDGKLYIPVGAPCNVCERDYNTYANLMRMDVDGKNLEMFAKGIRNTVGFDWDPTTQELWFTDNGRDEMGDNIPSDELNHAPKKGMHFGFPYCHAGDIADPEFGQIFPCSKFTKPAQELGAHVAALGMRFYTGNMFPKKYHNQIFIAQHGSWNRTNKIGYRVSFVALKKNKPVSYTTFAEGWQIGEKVWGRPVDILVLPDGSMLISDDFAGVIYRIFYSPK